MKIKASSLKEGDTFLFKNRKHKVQLRPQITMKERITFKIITESCNFIFGKDDYVTLSEETKENG
jgi:hypothetical protein